MAAWTQTSCGRLGYSLLDERDEGEQMQAGAGGVDAGTSSSDGGAATSGGTSSEGGRAVSGGAAGSGGFGGSTGGAGSGGNGAGGRDAGGAPIDSGSDGTTPEVPDARPFPRCTVVERWTTDFDSDPTALDGGPDGTWNVRGGAAFPATELGAGVWRSSTLVPLDTFPQNDFTTRVLADVRFRSVTVPTTTHGAIFWVNVNENAAQFSAILADLSLQPAGSQTLVVSGKVANTEVPLITVPDLPEAFVDLHLDVDPVAHEVSVWVGGAFEGKATFPDTSTPNGDRYATVTSWSGTSVFDSVKVERCAP